MRDFIFLVTLTNGEVEHSYEVSAGSKENAIIIAQAEAIKMARSHKFVSIKKLN